MLVRFQLAYPGSHRFLTVGSIGDEFPCRAKAEPLTRARDGQ